MNLSNSELNASLSDSAGERMESDEKFAKESQEVESTIENNETEKEESKSTEVDADSVESGELVLANKDVIQNLCENNIPVIAIMAFTGIFILAALILVFRKRRKKKKISESEITIKPTMDNSGSEISVKVLLDNEVFPVWIGRIHNVGRRSAQQDSFGISETDNIEGLEKKGLLAVVADGMGGLSAGEHISQMVVVKMLQEFDETEDDAIPSSVLLGLIGEANEAVNEELGEELIGKCGSTVVAIILKDKKLSWISVGDSHIYVYRNDKLVKLNTDHNYGVQLDSRAKAGEISVEEAATDPQRAALTSYIGMGDLELVDRNETPIAMESGDRILLMSDGVYGTVDESALTEMMALPFEKMLLAIDQAIQVKQKPNQDNYTCVVIEVK